MSRAPGVAPGGASVSANAVKRFVSILAALRALRDGSAAISLAPEAFFGRCSPSSSVMSTSSV